MWRKRVTGKDVVGVCFGISFVNIGEGISSVDEKIESRE